MEIQRCQACEEGSTSSRSSQTRGFIAILFSPPSSDLTLSFLINRRMYKGFFIAVSALLDTSQYISIACYDRASQEPVYSLQTYD